MLMQFGYQDEAATTNVYLKVHSVIAPSLKSFTHNDMMNTSEKYV